MTIERKHVGRRLRILRLERSLSQVELSKRTGIAQTDISRYETGAIEPRISTLARLAQALEVSVWQIFRDI